MKVTRVLVATATTVVMTLVASGCVVRARAPVYTGVVVTARPAVVVAQPQPVVVAQPQPTTVVVTQPVAQPQPVYAAPQPRVCGQCMQGTQELCNGCDDNCNGVIDESCR